MIPEAEDGKSWRLFQFLASALRFAVAEQHQDAIIKTRNKRLSAVLTLSNDFCDGIVTCSTEMVVMLTPRPVIVISFCFGQAAAHGH